MVFRTTVSEIGSIPPLEALVSKLTTLIFIFVSPTIAGAFVIGVLAADMTLYSAMPIIIAAAVGVIAAIPISYFISQAIHRETQRTRERIQDSGT
jgi:hypothetical protein